MELCLEWDKLRGHHHVLLPVVIITIVKCLGTMIHCTTQNPKIGRVVWRRETDAKYSSYKHENVDDYKMCTNEGKHFPLYL